MLLQCRHTYAVSHGGWGVRGGRGGGEKGCETRRVERLADTFYALAVLAYICCIPWRVGG